MSWPEIDGIDSAEARARWRDDGALFSSVLAQLFERFAGICRPTDEFSPEAVGDAAKRMHKLRGAASALGAKSIYFVAGQLEAAYLAGDLGTAAHLKIRLCEEMGRLQKSARPILDARTFKARAPVDAPIKAETAHELRRLDELLQRQDLAALALFQSVSPDLEQLLGEDPYRILLGHIENLRFDEAARDLRAAL